MRCPKCQFDHPSQTTECLKCGVVFSRYEAPPAPADGKNEEAASPVAEIATPTHVSTEHSAHNDARRELALRAMALPLALGAAWLAANSGFAMVSGMLTMVLHETGHAITAWFVGRWAIPMLWVTMHGDDRSWAVILLLAAAILSGGFLAFRARRWGWVCVAGALFVTQLIFLNAPTPGALIVFGGDGGALVLATILMATFYAPAESWLRRSPGLRWGLLAIGALSFMHVFHSWSGPYENIPFGEIEGVNLSDPSLLTEMYGWSVLQLVDRYIRLAEFCLAALAVVYCWGLISGYAQVAVTAQREAQVAQ